MKVKSNCARAGESCWSARQPSKKPPAERRVNTLRNSDKLLEEARKGYVRLRKLQLRGMQRR